MSEDAHRFPRRYGKYELLEPLGRGGMAEVFRARLPGIAGFEKVVVIKRLHPRFTKSPGFVQMFIDEAKLAAQVQHKNVVQVFELGSLDNGELFIAMEYVEGSDLEQLLGRARRLSQPLPPWFAVHVTVEILDALAYAHDLPDADGRPRNIVHNDVTPANVFIARQGDVKLGDFGVAQDDSRDSDPLPGQMKGKVPYMSPEQLSGLPVDARSDVFSAGIVLWEALTHRRLFAAETAAETMARICSAPRLPPSQFCPGLPPALDAVVLSALQIERTQRIGSAREFQSRLLGVLDQLRGRVDLMDVRLCVQPILDAEATPETAAMADDDVLDLAPDVDGDEAVPDLRASMTAAETAAHLQSPSSTGEFPAISTTPEDLVRQPPALDIPEPPPRRPPPRSPKPVTGRLRRSGSLTEGFSYEILGPEEAVDVARPPPAAAPSDKADVEELDGLFEQFLGDAFGTKPPPKRMPPSRPVREILAATRELTNRPSSKTPLPQLEAPHPFWVRFPDGREVGPLDPPVLLHYLGSRPYADAVTATVSADQVRWLSLPNLVGLLNETLVRDDARMSQCTFHGTLKAHSLTAVLGELARTDATGRLLLMRQDGDHVDRRELHIERGALTAVSQNRATFALWESLLTSKFFAQHHLLESAYTAVRIQRPVRDLVSGEAAAGLDQARGLMARQQLLEIYRWPHGHFGFDPSLEVSDGRPTPLLRLMPRMVPRVSSPAVLRRAVDRYMDTELVRSEDFDREVAEMRLPVRSQGRLEPFGHGYTLGESLAQTAHYRDEAYTLALAYVLLELRLLRPARSSSRIGARP